LQVARGSGAPAVIGQQVPWRPGRLQATQAPWQATLQQTLSEQNPEIQSSLPPQCPPGPLLPQLPVAKSQTCALHWLLAVQLVKQAFLLVSQA
jgi:hypothetical protein